MPDLNICVRKSGVVSMTTVVVEELINILLLSRLSLLFSDLQTWHLQAIMGTPPLVPVPKNSILIDKLKPVEL
jgi:hypothetical protein